MPERTEADGRITLTTLWDGLELAKACRALDDNEVPFAVEAVEKDTLQGRYTSYHLRVDAPDRRRAEEVLRDTMGLFPVQEVDAEAVFVDDGTMLTLGEFESSEDAERAGALLREAGIRYEMHGLDGDGEGEPGFRIEVESADLERGIQVVAEGLELR